MASSAIKRPPLFLFLTEIIRAIFELLLALPFIKKYPVAQQGDQHPVLVIPGFMASDVSTRPLRRFLTRLGYQPYGWELGRNLADLNNLKKTEQYFVQLFEKHQQPISLIGWSLGGVYARQIAKKYPEHTRQVITLASPFGGILEPNHALVTYRLVKWWKGYPELEDSFLEDLPTPAPVPTTAIFSKKDGIVPWETCLEQQEDDIHQNIEIASSHLGMGWDREALEIIADRLVYQKENWQVYSGSHDHYPLFIG